MSRKYEGIYVCHLCKAETNIDDKLVKEFIDKGMIKSPCKCGEFSPFSILKCKFSLKANDWRYGYGSSK